MKKKIILSKKTEVKTRNVLNWKGLEIMVGSDEGNNPCSVLVNYVSKYSKLKPCPFCGKQPKVTEDNGLEICIECKPCGASVYKAKGNYIKDAIKTWNMRNK